MGERLKGKVAIITGAGSIGPGVGNGKATAIVFAREGAKVMAVDLNLEAAEETRRLIEEEGGECFTFKADVAKASDCEKMVQACLEKFGRIDILHNNVGMGGYGGPVETSEEIWDRTMTINLKSMFLTCKYVLPHMERQGSGVIINISSINALRAQPYPALAYSVSKAGVIALTREVALEYAAKGIRCNAIILGLMRTPRIAVYYAGTAAGDLEEMWRRRDAMSPTGKQGDAWDTAYAALFLASEEAKYITGTTLTIDGGLSGTVRGW
ncbi:MAG TPA: SDR family oxidoreductase [Dehalococcoidia bacterium]|nr:SDR family oxidoreductase [Dehalococcoidia bacterium]